ncbi:hypothetical protein BE25_0240 [Staphylococcus phage vB_SepM_BE25]|nr:hypothetical protein BE24_0206 [Staphylococcus phage vB_SepM_BE24]WEU70726.1 hypothetical protein BE25_0240 [Staphylococcus phage vB_SepM_BE25]
MNLRVLPVLYCLVDTTNYGRRYSVSIPTKYKHCISYTRPVSFMQVLVAHYHHIIVAIPIGSYA